MKLSITEENYLKAIFKLAENHTRKISTTKIAEIVDTSAASVTDMLKRLSEKDLVEYQKYKGVKLTTAGNQIATQLIRKHRLWEVFLVDILAFNWDEVHDIAEELEHIASEELINRLESFLGHPRFDPHGDPIPSASGKFTLRTQVPLSEVQQGEKITVVGVKQHNSPFLKRLDALKIALGSSITMHNKRPYEQMFEIEIDGQNQIISAKIADNIFVKTDEK